MRKLTMWSAAAVTSILLMIGGAGATAAQAAQGACSPSASVRQTGTSAVASGKAMCQIEEGNTVGVTVILYVHGYSEASSYTECAATILADCVGLDVSYPTSSTDICARTIVTYETLGQRQTRVASTGTSCPF